MDLSMNRQTELPASLSTKSRVSPARIVYYAEADESIVESIRCGVLFVMAFWSGPSVVAFVKLTEVLGSLDPDARLEFVVVDTDGAPALYQRAEFIGRMHGMGETAWVKDGRILCSSLRSGPACFEEHTTALLAACAA
jgi:hypothetical protein